MKRDYISELRLQGLSLRQIEKQTGIDHRRLSEYSTGKKALKSSSKAYEKIRNFNRKHAYETIKKEGITYNNKTHELEKISPQEASKLRRRFYNPEIKLTHRVREVAHTKIHKNMHQLRIYAELQHDKTHEVKLVEGLSDGHADCPDTYMMKSVEFQDEMRETNVEKYDLSQEMFAEAIDDCRSKCGSDYYNWHLKRVLDVEVITYEIG